MFRTTYVPLTVITNYTFLEGASFPEEFVVQAAAFDLPGIAITDRDGMYGIVRAHVAARETGMKLIVGSVISRTDGPPLTLLAMNKTGYAAICRLIAAGRANREKGESAVDTGQIAGHCRRHVVAIHHALHHELDPGALQSIFGDRLYAALARYMLPGDDSRMAAISYKAEQLGITPVVAPSVSFHTRHRKGLSDVLSAIRNRTTVDSIGELQTANSNYTIFPPGVMQRLYHDYPAALAVTMDIADRCRFSLDEIKYHYPAEVVPEGETPDSYLEQLTRKKARERYPGGVPADVKTQLRRELNLIKELNYPNYFLTMYDIVRFAREQEILCQGRGSAANSAVCYVLGITAIDPVRSGLLFERFISRERNEPPDIDVDFEHERREEVIQYIYNRFGRNRAAMVAEFIRYRTRSAIRDVGKSLGFSLPQVERLSNLASSYRRDHEDWWERTVTAAGFPADHPRMTAFKELVRTIKAFPRHLSIHVGGFVISNLPIYRLVPIEPARMEDRTVIQWDKEDVEDAGLLKIDVLSLGMLTCLRRTFHTLQKNDIAELDLYSIPDDDPETYKMIRKADTVGTFQIESRAQMSMLPRLKPKEFYDLVVEVAIVRPGPIQGKMVHPYLRRRHGQEPVTYPLPELEPVLGRTYGVPLFQEQVMKLAMVAGGFSAGEADQLRRAMGTWRSAGRLEGILDKLVRQMELRGLEHRYALQIADQIKGFGEYGFPESHAASFALLAYASAYLKCHHPAAFTAALLNSQPMGFYSPATLVEDARRHDVPILAVCVNHSDWETVLESHRPPASSSHRSALAQHVSPLAITWGLRLGLSLVRGFPQELAERVEKVRHEGGLFRSLGDLLRRTGLPAHALLKLALAGAFSTFKLERREALWEVLKTCVDRTSLFYGIKGRDTGARPPPMSAFEVVLADIDVTRTYLSRHPFELVYPRLQGRRNFVTSKQLEKTRNGKRVVVGGLSIVKQRPPTAGGVLFLTLEDHTGFINLVVSPTVMRRCRVPLLEEPILLVDGVVEKAEGVINLRALQVTGIHLVEREQSKRFQKRDFR